MIREMTMLRLHLLLLVAPLLLDAAAVDAVARLEELLTGLPALAFRPGELSVRTTDDDDDARSCLDGVLCLI